MAQLSNDAAKRILQSRPIVVKQPVGTSTTQKLRIHRVSEEVFATTLLDGNGNPVYRRIVNYQATNGAKRSLPAIQEAIANEDWLTVLNETELSGGILSTSSNFDRLTSGMEVNAEITAVDGQTADGVAYDGMVLNVKILSIVEPKAPKADANFFMKQAEA